MARFDGERIMVWCGANSAGFVLGLAKNKRLIEAIATELEQAKGLFETDGQQWMVGPSRDLSVPHPR